ncbi:MAG: hypothetical protein U0U66_03180 [Cytophagaceae bacterium]
MYRVAFVLFFLINHTTIHASNVAYIVISYESVTDKPFYPIVLSSKSADSSVICKISKFRDKYEMNKVYLCNMGRKELNQVSQQFRKNLLLSRKIGNRFYGCFSISYYNKEGQLLKRFYTTTLDSSLLLFSKTKEYIESCSCTSYTIEYINDVISRLKEVHSN